MQQRRPRLGDVLDDYCPRERRVTNHVVVAMIEDDVKQTRCSTCDADHEYKQARVPSPRRPKSVAALNDGAESFEGKPVLAAPARAVPEAETEVDADAALESNAPPPSQPEPLTTPLAAAPDDAPVPMAASAAASAANDPGEERVAPEDEGPVHRPLMRAKLPRPEGHVPERKEPEFTVRQQGGRGGGGREVDGNSVGYRPKGQGHRHGGGFGHGGGGGQSRFGGQRHGSGQNQQRPGGGRGPDGGGQRGGRPDGMGNSRGQRGPGSGRRRGGR
jgi:hypothetical protein